MTEVSEGDLPGAAPGTPERVDGRRLRSARTRQAIIASYLELLREKRIVPTCEQVAERAGLSERVVFTHFADREGLATAAFDLILSLHKTTPAGDKLSASRDVRIRFQVDLRARVCEMWLPVWKVAITGRSQSPEVERRIGIVQAKFRWRLETMYAPELASLAPTERTATLIALDEITSFEGWERMREQYGLSYEAACNAWVYAIDRLLPPTP